jgi:hypothetical protein
VGTVLTPLPRLADGEPLIGWTMIVGHLHRDSTLAGHRDVAIGANMASAAVIIESLILGARRGGMYPALRSYRDQVKSELRKYL